MHCHICNKSEEGTVFVRGVYEGEIVTLCSNCARMENVPMIRRATQEQINKANVRYSVRERMERMSQKPKIIYDQAITHKNLSKLNFPQKRKDQEGLVENYDWKLKIARRKNKLSISQLALASGVSQEDIQKLESGQPISAMEPVVAKLEVTLNIQLLKYNSRIQQKQKEKPFGDIPVEVIEEPKVEKTGLFKKILSGKLDFSKKKDIENITLKDLAEMKRQREKGELPEEEIEVEELEEVKDKN
jgi:ribosome-binding protein aMBF1 (putative translation factor)